MADDNYYNFFDDPLTPFDLSGFIETHTCCNGDNGRHSDECPMMFTFHPEPVEEHEAMYNQMNRMEEELGNPMETKEYGWGYTDGCVAGAFKVLETLRLTPEKYEEIKRDIDAGKSVIISTLTVGVSPYTVASGYGIGGCVSPSRTVYGSMAGGGKSSASSGSFEGPPGNTKPTDPNEPWDHPADGNPPSEK